MRRRSVVVLLTVVLVVVSCGDGQSIETTRADAPTTTGSTTTTAPTTTVPEGPVEEVAPFHAIPVGSVVVWGTAVCDGSPNAGVNPDGGPGWLMRCEHDLSDPRVSGSETQDRFHYMAGRLWAGGVWVSEEAEITNAGGTWRGTAQGAEDHEGIPIGEAHYIGEDAYRGLEFHYYFFDSPLYEAVQIHGWISGGE